VPAPTTASAIPLPAWEVVINGFAVDFTHPGAGHDDWLARVSTWSSDELAASLAQTAPERIPDAHLEHLTPLATGDVVVDVLAEYDTGLQLVIRAQTGPAGWHVTFAEPSTSTPAP